MTAEAKQLDGRTVPHCTENCGCRVRVERNSSDIQDLWKELGAMKALLIGTLATAFVTLIGVGIQVLSGFMGG